MAPVKSAVLPLIQPRIIKQQLNFPGPVAQLREEHPAVVAHPQHPSGHRHRCVVGGFDRRGDGVAGRLADGVGVDAAVLQALQLGHPDPHLLGQPECVPVLGQIGPKLARGRARCRRDAAGPSSTRCLRRRDVVAGVRLFARRENGSTRKPSAITDATPTRGTSRASS